MFFCSHDPACNYELVYLECPAFYNELGTSKGNYFDLALS